MSDAFREYIITRINYDQKVEQPKYPHYRKAGWTTYNEGVKP